MKDNFVDYYIATMLRDKGLDINCMAYYDSNGELLPIKSKYLGAGIKQIDCHELNTLAPLYQQAINWFKTEHNIHIMFTDNEGMDFQMQHACKHIKDIIIK